MEFPYDRENFKEQVHEAAPQPVVLDHRAHLKKDGLMFIHPTQIRLAHATRSCPDPELP
jgi:DNA (cytosine-5)-methyltransferase 1